MQYIVDTYKVEWLCSYPRVKAVFIEQTCISTKLMKTPHKSQTLLQNYGCRWWWYCYNDESCEYYTSFGSYPNWNGKQGHPLKRKRRVHLRFFLKRRVPLSLKRRLPHFLNNVCIVHARTWVLERAGTCKKITKYNLKVIC